MKRIFLLFILLFPAVYAMAQLPSPFQKRVKPMPKAFERPSAKTKLNQKGAKSSNPWVVFSDRDDNYTTTTPGGSLFMKKLNFMEPFYVVEEKNGYVKLIRYAAGMLNGRKINDKKSATSYGWISRWKLLLWNKSYTDPQTGFPEKSIAIINGKLPLVASSTYFDRTDSAYVYSSPELKKVTAKVRLHQINYIFKKSEDGRKYLIGNEDQLVADSARRVIYGWIAADAVHNWGQRLYISPLKQDGESQTDSAALLLHQEHADPLLVRNDVILRSAPVISGTPPANYMVGKAADVYNKSHNMLITINGSQLKYPDYLDLRKNIHYTNVVFVIDGGSSMAKYFGGLTNTIQSFENIFNEYGKKHQLSYGAVVYRDQQNCTAKGVISTDAVYPDYRKLMGFLVAEAEKTRQCNGNIVPQPLHDGVRAALKLLKPFPNQTNLVVLIGSTGSTDSVGLSEEFGRQNVRLLSIQTYSEYNKWYNNFVLQSKRLVAEAAVFSAEKKKGLLINGEGLDNRETYNTTHLDSISFYLDYPKNSLIQGGVVFPTKGTVISNKSMTTAMGRFLRETDFDIHQQITSLDSAFRLSGIVHKNLSDPVKAQLELPVGEEVADRMPHNGFKYYMTSSVPANMVKEHRDQLQYTVVLNGAEYKQVNDIIALMAGQNLQPDQSSFRRKLVKNYLNISQQLLDLDLSKSRIKSMTLLKYLQSVTGLPVENSLLEQFKVKDLKSESRMKTAGFESYIRFLIRAGDNIKINTQVGQQFISNGKTYYYITQENFKTLPENQ